MEAEVMVRLENANTAVFLAGGVTQGGCDINKAVGVFGAISSTGHWMIANDISMVHARVV